MDEYEPHIVIDGSDFCPSCASLRTERDAAIAAKEETWKANDELNAEVLRLGMVSDEAQAQLCKAREIYAKMHEILMVNSSLCDSATKLTSFGEYIQDGFIALSLSSPCRHAEELTRLHEKMDREKMAEYLCGADRLEWGACNPDERCEYLDKADDIIAYLSR